MLRRPFRRVRDGGVEVTLSEQEVEALGNLAADLATMLGRPDAAPNVRERLFPRAYLDPTEETAEEEWQRLMHSELLRGKLQALEVVAATMQRATRRRGGAGVTLDDDETAAWLGALNDARLSLGAMLGITEDLDLGAIDPDDPANAPYVMYDWLTWLQSRLLEAVAN